MSKSTRSVTRTDRVATTGFLLIWILFIVGLPLAFMGNLLLSWNKSVIWKPQQEALAHQFGLKMSDYASPTYFPLGYYQKRLRLNTSVSEVHSVIQNYSKVINCAGYREIYYYFSSSEDWALRIEVWYDEDFKLTRIQSEDEDSRTIFTEGCGLGLLQAPSSQLEPSPRLFEHPAELIFG